MEEKVEIKVMYSEKGVHKNKVFNIKLDFTNRKKNNRKEIELVEILLFSDFIIKNLERKIKKEFKILYGKYSSSIEVYFNNRSILNFDYKSNLKDDDLPIMIAEIVASEYVNKMSQLYIDVLIHSDKKKLREHLKKRLGVK